jgi:glycolate oxidase FAD binding subunit
MAVMADWTRSPQLAEFGASRPGDAGDAVDGEAPAIVVEPADGVQMGRALAWASQNGLATVIRGRGTKLAWGRAPAKLDVILSTAHLNGAIVHRHGDLTATLPAGLTVADCNRQLAKQGQWLPVDSAFEAATVGGLVATNDSGPLRHRYGTPRDLLIGITLALTDGTLVKSGGHVVKNVAGYDLAKLVSGSFGTLAAIVDATFKLLPIPHTSRTVLVEYADDAPLAQDVAALSASQLEPTACDIHVLTGHPGGAPRRVLAIRFATSPAATAAQTAEAQRLVQGQTRVLADAAEAAWWSEQVRRPWTVPGMVLRLGWRPADLPHVLTLIGELRRASGGALELTGRAALGAGMLRLDVETPAAGGLIERLRAPGTPVGNVTVLRHGLAPKGAIDPWGPPPPAMAALAALKRSFDPAGILNAGRGPI